MAELTPPINGEKLWTYRVPVEFEVSARTRTEARDLVDEALMGDALPATVAEVQRHQVVTADGDVWGVLGWNYPSTRATPGVRARPVPDPARASEGSPVMVENLNPSPQPESIPIREHTVTIAFEVPAHTLEEASFLVTQALSTITDEAVESDDAQRRGLHSWTQVPTLPIPPGREVMPPGWEDFEGSGIPEIVAEMFPPAPRLQDFRLPDGGFDQDAYDGADEQWRDRCLSLAISASRLPVLLERLEVAERVRDGLLDLVERSPLREPPDTAALEAGPGDTIQARHDAARWRAEFVDAVLHRDAAIEQLLIHGGQRTSYLPERFHREWLPADLLAVQTLHALVNTEGGGRAAVRLLDRRDREQLRAMLHAADREVTVPDPDDPAGPPIYQGAASEAHRRMPPGVYDATGTDGTGQLRLVVGRAPVGDTITASAAFPAVEHDSAAMNEIARVLEQAPQEDPTLVRLRDIVATTGRGPSPAVGGSPGRSVSGLLAGRERQLHPRYEHTRDAASEPHTRPREL